jgi:hypothetical protein
MSPRLRNLVRRRAGFRCEYCHLPENVAELRFQVDHVVAAKHGGDDEPDNLAWSCYRCNTHKGPNLTGRDEKSGEITRLFNPRSDLWYDHFRWAGARLMGKANIGRATVNVLCINRPDSVGLRKSLLSEGIEF